MITLVLLCLGKQADNQSPFLSLIGTDGDVMVA
jgi:hypothetical protein